MEQLNRNQVEEIKSGGESRYVEFKQAESLDDGDEVLVQVTAFSNRSGGHILFGLKDDGTIQGASFDEDKAMERIGNWLRDRTSPVVDFVPRLYSGEDGKVLDLSVRRRRGIPIAIVKRPGGHEI